MSNTNYLDAENYYNVVRNSNNVEMTTTEENDFADKINAYNAFDPAMRQQSINNYNGALKYNLPTLGDYAFMSKTEEQPKITHETEQKVKRYAPSSAQLFAMADSTNSLVVQEYFKQMAQYEKSMRELNASDAPKDIKDISASKVMPYEKKDVFNTFESVLYGSGTGLDNAKLWLESAAIDYSQLSIERLLPEELKNVDLKTVTDDFLKEIAKRQYPDNEGQQHNAFLNYRSYVDIMNNHAEHLFENAPQWAEKAKDSGTFNEFIFDVSSGITQMVPLVAGSLATGGSTIIPFIGSFAMVYGQSLEEYRQDPLAKQENIREAALINAVASSILETIGVKGVAKNFLNPKSPLAHTVKNWAMGAVKEGGTEYLQAYPEHLARHFARGNFDNAEAEAVKNLLQEYFSWTFQGDALYQGAVGAFAGGIMGAPALKGEYHKKAGQLASITEARNFAREQPEIFQRFVSQLKNNGVEIPDVYVSAKMIDSLKQERAEGVTDFDKQPLDIFLEEAGISREEFETSLASGSTLEIQGERLHKILQTDIGMRLLQDNAISTSSKFETDGMDSLLTSLYQQKKMQDNAENLVNSHVESTQNANADFDEYNEYTLKEELEMSPEEYAEVQNVQAYMDVQEKAYNEEKYFTQQIVNDIEENTRLTDNPYSPTQSKTLASLFMAEIKTYAENYNIPLQEAYKQRRPLFLGNVASTQDIDTLIARAKEEAGLANFNKDAVEKENALYQQQEAEAKLQEEIKEWENKVDDIAASKKIPSSEVLMLKQTPLIMSLIGKDTLTGKIASENGIYASPHFFDGTHPNMTPDMRKQIPQALDDPIAIFDSDNPKNRKNGDIVFMLDIKDSNGATTIVPVTLNVIGNNRVEINIATSAYTKENNGVPSDKWFENQIQTKKNARYINGQKMKAWQTGAGVYFPITGLTNAHKNKIYNENDLVKLKGEYPAYYQEQPVIQGSITPVEGAKSIIRFFTATDISTGFHEFGHYMRFAMKQKADLENARTQDIKDWKKACEFVGAKDGEIWTREQEEKFTDAVMEYLHTGEAPSKGLKRVFANIARWLTKLYQKVSRSGIEISPEMKAVFDRQLATEKEILAARQKIGISEVNSILTNIQESDLSYLSDEERERYNALVHESDIDAYSSLLEKKGRELEENRKTWKQNAEIAFKLDRDNQELAYIMDKGGIYLSEDLLDQYQISLQAIKKARPFQYNKIFTADKSKSVDIDEVAERFGFDGNGAIADLFGQMAAIPNKQSFIDNYMAEQELLWRKEWSTEETVLNDKAEEALEVLANGLAKKIGVANLDNKKLRRAVISALKDNKIGEIEKYIEKYETAARESSLVEKAQARKIEKLEEKIIQQRLDLLNQKRIALAVLREKYKAREMRNKGVRYVKRVAKTKPKDIDFAYSEQIKALANKFGFTGKSLMPRDKAHMPALRDFVAKNELDSSVFPEWLLASPMDENISYKDLSVEEFAELMDVFKVLEFQGKDIKQVEIAGKKQRLEDRVNDLTNTASSLTSKQSITDWEKKNTIKGKTVSLYRELAANLTQNTYVFGAADGFLKGHEIVKGIHYQTFLQPLYDAQKVSYTLNAQLKPRIDAILEPIKKMPKKKRIERWTLDVPLSKEVQRHWGTTNNWNYERMIMVALNMGNADNKKKLMDGYGWTEEHLALITSRMTAEDWQLVQNIWDTINMLYPEMNRVYKEINGIPMKKVDADKLQTPYGVLNGGYFPLMYDSKLADNMEAQKKLDFDLFQENNFSVNIAKAADGFTKDRKSGSRIPVKLDFSVINKHLTDGVQYIAYAKPVHEIRKVIMNDKFASMFKDKFGEDIYKGLEPWLANIAKPQKEMLTSWENLLEKGRHLGTIYALGYNIKTALLSFTGVSPFVKEIGFDGMAYGIQHVLKNPREAYKFVQENSTLMADRKNNVTYDISQNMAKYNPTNAPVISISAFGKTYDFYWKDLEQYAFSFVTATDIMVSYSGWIGAYHKALMKNGGDIENAKAYADMIVERSQSSGTAMHLIPLQRGKGLKKILTMFITYSINVQNYLAYETRGLMEGKITPWDYSMFMLSYFTVPAIMTVLINSMWNDGEILNPFSDDDDEKKKAYKEYGKEIFLNSYLQGIPILRNFVSKYEFGQSNVSGSSIIDKGITDPVDAFIYGCQFVNSLFDENADSEEQFAKFIKYSINAGSYWTAIPAHRVMQIYNKASKTVDWFMEQK